MSVSYIDAIGLKFPNVQATCSGDPTVYTNIVWVGGAPLPTQSQLDEARLTLAQVEICTAINSFRSSWMGDHMSWNNHRWNCDRSSVSNLTGLILLTSQNSSITNIVYRDYDNINVTMTAAMLQGLSAAIFTFFTSCYEVCWNYKAQVNALTSYDAVMAFNYTSGWPPTGLSIPIAAVPSLSQFEIANDYTAVFTDPAVPAVSFNVTGSTTNNGTYTVASVAYDASVNMTIIAVNETIPSTAVNGSIYIA